MKSGWHDFFKKLLGWLSVPRKTKGDINWAGHTNVELVWGDPRIPLKSVTWSGQTNLVITWSGPAGSLVMKQHRYPVRRVTPQRLTYTFYDDIGNVIDLTDYDNVRLIVKLQGSDADTVDADFLNKPLGQVRYTGMPFDTGGEWSAQFVCLIGTGEPLYGEPVRFTVAKNVDDLTGSELPEL